MIYVFMATTVLFVMLWRRECQKTRHLALITESILKAWEADKEKT
jgi:hypothetical protein